MLKSHATIIELDISIGDLKLNFTPSVGLWFAALNESESTAKLSYFGSVYNIENIESQLLDYDNIGVL